MLEDLLVKGRRVGITTLPHPIIMLIFGTRRPSFRLIIITTINRRYHLSVRSHDATALYVATIDLVFPKLRFPKEVVMLRESKDIRRKTLVERSFLASQSRVSKPPIGAFQHAIGVAVSYSNNQGRHHLISPPAPENVHTAYSDFCGGP